MTGRLLRRIALAGLIVAATSSMATAQSWPPKNFEAFTAACQGQQGMLFYVEDAPAGPTPAIERLCGCVAGELGDASQSDIDLLTKDLLGTSTDTERMAYETYEDLSAFAGQAVTSCAAAVNAGVTTTTAEPPQEPAPEPAPVAEPAPLPAPEPMAAPEPAEPQVAEVAPEPAPVPEPQVAPTPEPVVPEPAPAPAPSTRMTAEASSFLNACGASKAFHDYLEGLRDGASGTQGGICTCLTSSLMVAVAPSDLTLLQRDFVGAAANEDYQNSETYAEAATTASGSLRSCMSDAGVPVNF